MNKVMVDLSIIIVSWNTRELLRECLISIYRYTKGITFEIFVVDNDSSDGSVALVRELFPHVNLIDNDYNAGFSKANNQAIRVSKGRYVALMNPDTLLIEDVFSPLIKYANQNPKIGAIGPKIFCRDGKSIQYSCARRLPNLYFEFCRLSGLTNKFPKTIIFSGMNMSCWDHESSRYVEALSGACMIVRKDTIDDVGLLDENQFMYGDEIDWFNRILCAGWRVYYYSDASIIHYGGESSKQVSLLSAIMSERALRYYYQKHRWPLYAYLFSLQVFLFSFTKYVWNMLFRSKDSRVTELMKVYKSLLSWSFKEISGLGSNSSK